MIKSVVFDLNGVFIQSELLTKRIEDYYHIPSNESLAVLKESMKRVRLDPNIAVFSYWKDIFKKHTINIREEEFLKFWFTGESIVSELIQISKALRNRNIQVYIFSNNFKERTEYYRKNFKEIFNNVDGAFFSWETGYVKSDIKAFEYLLDVIKLDPNEVLYFDDSKENIQLATSLGIEAYIYEGVDKTKEMLHEKGII